ncbi:MAG: peptide chain release factor 2 [Clostridia bacterium]|nr:peptide chain release factor 2 [Clostridia bacterium]
MIDFYIQRQQLDKINEQVNTLKDALGIDEARDTLARLTELSNSEDFWQDIDNAQKVNREITILTRKIKSFDNLKLKYDDTVGLLDLIEEMDEESEVEEANLSVTKLSDLVAELSIQALLKGKYDNNNAILSLHAGAGGTEAQDWVEMLFRMYTRYAERSGYKVRVLDKLDGDDAGIKSVTFTVEGENAYGYLKSEMGVHRLVRISPFDANKRRHTSFASLEVMPEITDEADIKVAPEEIKVDTYRSGGAGGQHVNKTDSAVRITHIPTGIVVQCQNERSQIQNRETAMKMLIGKLTELKERERMEEAQSIKGEMKKIEWGSQIRSYVFCPYTLVKDHRTNFENANVSAVMDGDLQDFIIEYLKKS